MRTICLLSLVLFCGSVSAQKFELRPETKQSIALYLQSKGEVDAAVHARDGAPAVASTEEKKKLETAVADATERRDAAFSSLTGKDQLGHSLAHLHVQKANAISRLVQGDRDVVSAFSSRRRSNVQSGESAATGGTTSLAALANATDWISAAFENGALAKESKGTVTTLRVSGYGVYSWLAPQSTRPCALSNPVCDTSTEMSLRGLSGSISIDNSTPNQSTAQPVQSNTTSAPVLNFLQGGGRVTSTSGRFQFLQRAKIETAEQINEWRRKLKNVEPEAADLSLAIQKFAIALKPVAVPFQEWRREVRTKADASAGQAELEQEYGRILQEFYSNHASDLNTLEPLYQARTAFHAKLAKELGDVLLKPAATLEYLYASPSGQQSTSGARFVIDKKLFRSNAGGVSSNDVERDSNATLTANAAFNWYNNIPQGIQTGRMRDAQVSAQLDRAIGSATKKVRSSVSLAGYYQYQINPAILTFDQNAVTPGPSQIPIPAAALLDSKGHIGIVQGKLTLRLTDSISIPLAVSWANRTEFIKASTVKGQFGIAIDLGNLLGK